MEANKKVMIPVGIILAIALVVAGVVYVNTHYEINKTIDVTINHNGGGGGGQPQDTYVNVSLTGDIADANLTCTATDTSCSVTTGDIVLTNIDTADHECNVTSDVVPHLTVAYSFGSSPVTVPASGSVIFNITYSSDLTGTYPIKTVIDC